MLGLDRMVAIIDTENVGTTRGASKMTVGECPSISIADCWGESLTKPLAHRPTCSKFIDNRAGSRGQWLRCSLTYWRSEEDLLVDSRVHSLAGHCKCCEGVSVPCRPLTG